MLFQTHNGAVENYGYGDPYSDGAFGAPTLTQGTGKDFNCNSAICFGIGAANDQLFKTLQMKINVLAGPAGVRPLVVDGFIGAATVAALGALSKIGVSEMPSTKEGVAANAPAIVSTLDAVAKAQAAQGTPLAPPGTPVTFTPPTPQSVAVATQAIQAQLPGSSAAAAAASLPKPKSKTLLLIAGGLAAVLVVGGAGYFVYRRKARREF